MNKEEFVKECVKEGLIIYGTTWESNLKRLKELKKYKKIVEEIEERLIPGKANEVPDGTNIGELSTLGFVRLIIKDVKKKYFPPPSKTTSLHLTATGANEDIDRLYKWIDKLEDFMRSKDMGFALAWEDEGE